MLVGIERSVISRKGREFGATPRRGLISIRTNGESRVDVGALLYAFDI